MKNTLIIVLLFQGLFLFSQNVYMTPSGERYHLGSCRMVENVSSKLLNSNDIRSKTLTPCAICKPPQVANLTYSSSATNKAVGEAETVRCKGTTQRGTHCQHMTSLANGYCYQHTVQNSSNTLNRKSQSGESRSSLCLLAV